MFFPFILFFSYDGDLVSLSRFYLPRGFFFHDWFCLSPRTPLKEQVFFFFFFLRGPLPVVPGFHSRTEFLECSPLLRVLLRLKLVSLPEGFLDGASGVADFKMMIHSVFTALTAFNGPLASRLSPLCGRSESVLLLLSP